MRFKHGNKKVVIDGLKFDSKREAARWQELLLLERTGSISGLERQKTYILAPKVLLDGRIKPCLRYVADFLYVRGGIQVIEDSKSPHLRKNPVYRIKKHLLKSVLGLDVLEV